MDMSVLNEIGISREDVIDRAAEKAIEQLNIASDFLSSIERRCVDAMMKEARSKIDVILDSALSDLLDQEFQPVDEWGDTVAKATTLRALVKDRALSYLTDKVNESGKTSSYQSVGTRAEWLAKNAAKDAMDYATKKEISDAVKKAKDDMKKLVANHIAETLLKR